MQYNLRMSINFYTFSKLFNFLTKGHFYLFKNNYTYFSSTSPIFFYSKQYIKFYFISHFFLSSHTLSQTHSLSIFISQSITLLRAREKHKKEIGERTEKPLHLFGTEEK